jgi:hypothetical protein
MLEFCSVINSLAPLELAKFEGRADLRNLNGLRQVRPGGQLPGRTYRDICCLRFDQERDLLGRGRSVNKCPE